MSDSMISYLDRPYTAKSMRKVSVYKEYAWSFAGDAVAGDYADHFWKPPAVPKTADIDDFVMTKVLTSLRKVMNENNYVVDPKDTDAGFDALVMVRGHLYQVDHNYGWMKDDKGLYAVGSGGNYALGALAALSATEQDLDTAVAIGKYAISIASKYNLFVGEPAQYVVQERK